MIRKKVMTGVFLSAMALQFLGCSSISANLGACASSPAEPPPLVKKQLTKTTQSWDENLLPAYPQGQPEVTILRLTIPPGARLENHQHPIINAGVVISGELTVLAESGKVLYLKSGDPIVELVNTTHYGINQGKEPVDLIVFYAGIKDQPISVPAGKGK